VYCGYIGGDGFEEARGIAVDQTGNAYVCGYTGSPEATFPVKTGPNLTHNVSYDAFVAKFKADGTGLVYCGYIGGDGIDEAYSIVVDQSGNAYVCGYTGSTETTFPVQVGPDLAFNGGDYDAFVAKVTTDGTGLVYCGYIGGDSTDYAYGIAVDQSGNTYVCGYTISTQTTFPVKTGPDLTHNGFFDAFVAELKADGTELVYCGYVGGDDGDEARSIAVDSNGNTYVCGYTKSTEATFPVKNGPYPTYNGGTYDSFVAKIHIPYVPLDLLLLE
jgi:hypothetical protein